MKYAWLALLLLFAACTSETEYGDCIGAFDDSPDSTLVYQTSTRNVALAVIFSELVVPPIVVIASETRCPIAKRTK